MTNPTREETPMSENMFQDFASPERVLDEYVMAMNRLGTISESLQARADALARIAELSPRTVDEGARWRAIQALRGCLSTYAPVMANADTPSHVALAEPLGMAVDRIIDALGWTAAEPDCGDCGDCGQCCPPEPPDPAPATPPSIVTEEQRERFNRVWGELYTVSPPLYSEFHQLIAALGATFAENPTAPTGDGRAVDLDVTALDCIRAVLNCHENTRAAMDKLPMFGDMPDIIIPGALPMRITTNPFGVSVLRIGGGQ